MFKNANLRKVTIKVKDKQHEEKNNVSISKFLDKFKLKYYDI